MKKNNPIHIKKKNRGKLHEMLGVDPSKPIPSLKLHEALRGGTPLEKKRAQFALNAKKFNHK